MSIIAFGATKTSHGYGTPHYLPNVNGEPAAEQKYIVASSTHVFRRLAAKPNNLKP